jgi:hypothetical protein
VADERRTDAMIRSEISAEREHLVDALAELREGIAAKRRIAAAVGTLVVAGLATTVSVKIARRFRGE